MASYTIRHLDAPLVQTFRASCHAAGVRPDDLLIAVMNRARFRVSSDDATISLDLTVPRAVPSSDAHSPQ